METARSPTAPNSRPQCVRNIAKVLERAGSSPRDLVRVI
jgi:hypothetical protein